MLRFGGLVDVMTDEQWSRAMEYISIVSELNYMSQIVIMLYEDPTKNILSEERFHVELHFSPGVNCCVCILNLNLIYIMNIFKII